MHHLQRPETAVAPGSRHAPCTSRQSGPLRGQGRGGWLTSARPIAGRRQVVAAIDGRLSPPWRHRKPPPRPPALAAGSVSDTSFASGTAGLAPIAAVLAGEGGFRTGPSSRNRALFQKHRQSV
jgi:hypothetical protein